MAPYAWLKKSLETVHRAHWYRSVKTIEGRNGPIINLNGNPVINFGSNDYLGLAGDDRVIQKAIEALQTYGTGSTGSRLLTGHRDLHECLEGAIATLKKTEDALVFSSGYLANLGAITALVTSRDLILEDEYNHASLKKGARLSGAQTVAYQHGQTEDLYQKLKTHRSQYRRCLITTDMVFSMDGDLCPLPDLLNLADDFDSMLLVDEAHATGVLGATGAGGVEYFRCTGEPLIQVGTLSKALASLGGYVAGSSLLIDFLRNRASTWIYTTGLSPADTGAALGAIEIIENEPARRQQLWHNVTQLKTTLSSQFPLFPSDSPIVCVPLNTPLEALYYSEQLQEKGFFVPAIRPPTVPSSRLRFSVMATHTPLQIEELSHHLKQIKAKID